MRTDLSFCLNVSIIFIYINFFFKSSPSKWVSSSDVSNYPSFVGGGVLDTVSADQGQSQSLNYPSTAAALGGTGSIKHEHVHYHYEQVLNLN